MSYLVKYTGEGTSGLLSPQAPPVYWKNLETRWVENECIAFYQQHPAVFTILKDQSGVADLVSEDSSGATYIGEIIRDEVFVGGKGAAYIDFNATGEAGMSITIDDIVFQEADTAVPATGVWTNGASAANSATSLIAAINGDTRTTLPFEAWAAVSTDGVWVGYKATGLSGFVDVETTSAANCTVPTATEGAADVAVKRRFSALHTVNAQELLSGAIEILVPLPWPFLLSINAFSDAGSPIYFTDKVEMLEEPDRIRISTFGATNLAADNVLHITAWEQ